jgi:hypothetical protein
MSKINLSNNTYWFGTNPQNYAVELTLPVALSSLTRVITIKEATGYISSLIYLKSAVGDSIEVRGNNSIAISTLQSITLQSVSSSYWSFVSFYSNVPYETTKSPAGAAIVYPSEQKSSVNIDLRSNRKIVTLPNTYHNSTGNLFMTIKDIYGSASTNALFVSTPQDMYFEGGAYLYSTIRLTSSFTSIDLMANSNRYSILNRYP